MEAAFVVFNSLILSRITYAIQSWFGLLSMTEIQRLEIYIKRAIKYHHCKPGTSFREMASKMDKRLYMKAQREGHILQKHFPHLIRHRHNLRNARAYQIPSLNNFNEKNFITRMHLKLLEVALILILT